MRQIFGIHTTYIDRSKTNKYVIDYANLQLQREKPGAKPILWLSEVHEDLKIKMLYRLLRLPSDDPQVNITFQSNTLLPIDIGKRRVGRPRLKWIDTTLEQAWKRITRTQAPQFRYEKFDPQNPQHVIEMQEAAKHDELGRIN